MRRHEACAKTESKLTSPLERERGTFLEQEPGCSQASRRVHPVPGGLGTQPGSCSPPAPTELTPSSALGRTLQWEGSCGGTVGVSPHLGGSGWLLRGGSGARWSPGPEGGWAVWRLARDQGSFGVIRDPLRRAG